MDLLRKKRSGLACVLFQEFSVFKCKSCSPNHCERDARLRLTLESERGGDELDKRHLAFVLPSKATEKSHHTAVVLLAKSKESKEEAKRRMRANIARQRNKYRLLGRNLRGLRSATY